MDVFKSPVILGQLGLAELAALEADFIQYQSSDVIPDLFGRDALYDHPDTLSIVRIEEVRHIHLANPEKPWRKKTLPFYRTSDTHLVYCTGALHPDVFLLMAILRPNAHDLARSRAVMLRLGEMAENFRKKW